MILSGDIGGTHTRLALFEKNTSAPAYLKQTFSSRSYSNLREIIAEYLEKNKAPLSAACFGIAGPVQNGHCHVTNLPWAVDATLLSQELKIPVFLLNDLVANGYGLRTLRPEELFVLQEGIQRPGNGVLLSAGTGLGESGLYWDGEKHHPFASEGGHTDFAAQTDEEMALCHFVQQKYGHVSYERLVSGPGIQTIYQFLCQTHAIPRPAEAELEALLRNPSQDRARIISEWGSNKRDPLCQRTMEWFLTFYGAAAGNAALHFLAIGGVYLGGGIAPHLLDLFKEGLFLVAFSKKGRFQELLETIPVRIILNDDTALLGAAEYARDMWAKKNQA